MIDKIKKSMLDFYSRHCQLVSKVKDKRFGITVWTFVDPQHNAKFCIIKNWDSGDYYYGSYKETQEIFELK